MIDLELFADDDLEEDFDAYIEYVETVISYLERVSIISVPQK
jgi:hypothetical protein